ncbi:CDGSH iron-sulfur domain-containing protein 3, mitochondrial-like isoform X2 [Argiope bruennichi]|uniref:CDGSH iron-sulfur domain-containing protein like n=2 Tax=Argiope bruennichi TaxID=94029 RepID=A0A8T0G338_ARGBR|nr:CDGSH iron-sulfur domain-containing protein 3, mitochondrial-like isoform X2 [Argiope bruennichi]XP_055947569.1 CDGSH iron-sulfur domain-containing protein 3, mitochondrial-like isoform X2 [Argiope bruennichi]KAF8796858.1 CDGSH iron-sulfur domain-containing protein like [Argiope bruennichi]
MALLKCQRGMSFSLQKFIKMSNSFIQNPCTPSSYTGFLNYSSRRNPDVSDIPELNEPPLKKFYEAYYQPEHGRIHDKKPFKIKCTKGKTYYWCVCGWSHDQPLCDGKCILPEMKIKMKPVAFKPAVTREYWFCNCKQTKNRPFCDGSHLSETVQGGNSVIRR